MRLCQDRMGLDVIKLHRHSSLYPAQEKFWTSTGCLAKDLGTSNRVAASRSWHKTQWWQHPGKPGEVGTWAFPISTTGLQEGTWGSSTFQGWDYSCAPNQAWMYIVILNTTMKLSGSSIRHCSKVWVWVKTWKARPVLWSVFVGSVWLLGQAKDTK